MADGQPFLKKNASFFLLLLGEKAQNVDKKQQNVEPVLDRGVNSRQKRLFLESLHSTRTLNIDAVNERHAAFP